MIPMRRAGLAAALRASRPARIYPIRKLWTRSSRLCHAHTQEAPNKASTSGSVSPDEVSHFNALASSWWDPQGPSRLLHLMNPIRHEFLRGCLTSSRSTGKLHYLDIGCGGGIFAESAARLPTTASVTAIDPSPEVLKVAEAHGRRDPTLQTPGRLAYLNLSIEQLASNPTVRKDGYDVVSIFEVLEHVSRPSSFLDHVLPHVAPGGWLVLSTIARTWASWIVTNVIAEDVLQIVPPGTHDWHKYVNEAELRDWFVKRPGWESPRAMGVMYVPGFGWKEVPGSENVGNYFFAIRRSPN
jgi:polyprenyldihydroxybenzoate methyltransferase/3-demethylubiquinol 3-O-methyltransferase